MRGERRPSEPTPTSWKVGSEHVGHIYKKFSRMPTQWSEGSPPAPLAKSLAVLVLRNQEKIQKKRMRWFLSSLSRILHRKYLSSCGPRKRIIVPLVDKIVSENENVLIESKQIAEELVQALATQTMFGS